MSEKNDVEKPKSENKETVTVKQKTLTLRFGLAFAKQSKPVEKRIRRQESMDAIGSLLQCGMCLNQLNDPRMLPCQHTFCLGCLKTHLTARNLKTNGNVAGEPKLKQSIEPKIFCSICNKEYVLADGFDSLEQLPKNLHVDSLLKIVEGNGKTDEKKGEDRRCLRCRKEQEVEDIKNCRHCDQTFCTGCWKDHLENLGSNLDSLVVRLAECESKLIRKIEDFEIRCDRVEETVKEVIQQKIAELEKVEKNSLREISSMKREANVVYEALEDRVKFVKKKIESNVFKEGNEVRSYMDLQKEATKLLAEVVHFAEAKIGFNPETLRLEQQDEDIYNIEDAKQTVVKLNPFESLETMVKFFQTKSFKPRVIWNKCPRPGGIGIPPWDHGLLLVSAPDGRCVYVLERSRLRLARRLRHDTLLTPTGVCFCAARKVTYVADARGHVVHAFAADGEHSGAVGEGVLRAPHGVAVSPPTNELAVCDAGHDRVVVMDAAAGSVRLVLGGLRRPEGVAVVGDGRIVVADTGNDAVKIFGGRDGRLLSTVGMPRPSAVTVGPFDVIGAHGTADRPLLMTSDGAPIETRGHAHRGNVGHASGLLVTPELDVLVADALARRLVVF